jgi:hypothetical protein
MAGIVSATKVQVETAYRAVHALELTLRLFNQNSEQPTKLASGRPAQVDALVAAAVTALAPLNT